MYGAIKDIPPKLISNPNMTKSRLSISDLATDKQTEFRKIWVLRWNLEGYIITVCCAHVEFRDCMTNQPWRTSCIHRDMCSISHGIPTRFCCASCCSSYDILPGGLMWRFPLTLHDYFSDWRFVIVCACEVTLRNMGKIKAQKNTTKCEPHV